MSTRRLNKELPQYPRDGEIRFIECKDDNVLKQTWLVIPRAGDTIAFDGVNIIVNVSIPNEYPFKPPTIEMDEIYHPNVHEKYMCLDKVNNWNPKYTIYDIIKDIHHTVMHPNTDRAINPEAANLYLKDKKSYISRALSEK